MTGESLTALLGYDYVMRCPSCDSEVPGRDLVCSECGAFVYRNVPPAPREPESGGGSEVVPRQPSATWGPQAPVAGIPPAPSSSNRLQAGPGGGYPSGSGGPDYVYPTLQGWPGLGPEEAPTESAPAGLYGQSHREQQFAGGYLAPPPDVQQSGVPVRVIDEAELQRRGRVMGRWSIGLAVLSLLIPLVGPVGIVTGYFAWRLGETRLGRIGVIASVVAMVAGVAIAMLAAPVSTA